MVSRFNRPAGPDTVFFGTDRRDYQESETSSAIIGVWVKL